MREYKAGDICPSCGQGTLARNVIDESFEYKEQKLIVSDYPIYACNDCQEEFIDEITIEATEKKIRDFQRKVDNLLTSDEIVALRKELGLTQSQLAEKLGVSRITIARYEGGQLTQGKSQNHHLRLMLENPACLNSLETNLAFWPIQLVNEPALYNPNVRAYYQSRIVTQQRPSIISEDNYNDGKNPIALAA